MLTFSELPQAIEYVCKAAAEGSKLGLQGGGGLAFLFGADADTRLGTSDYSGITLYEPGELVIRAKAGTRLSEITALLEKAGQSLPVDPVTFRNCYPESRRYDPTIGSLVALNASGSLRLARGALRDQLLGVEFINGRGELIKSGGRVMKNVTGYDLTKLMAGSRGRLGLLTEVTLKTAPLPEKDVTLAIPCTDITEAGRLMRGAFATPCDPAAAAWVPDAFAGRTSAAVLIRITGLEASVDYRANRLQRALAPGDLIDSGIWQDVAHAGRFLPEDWELCRFSCPATEGPDLLKAVLQRGGEGILDWAGSLVWARADDLDVEELAAKHHAHGLVLRHYRPGFLPVSASQQALETAVKRALDPHSLFV